MGGIVYGPYTGTWFDSTSQTDIEHIVARSEAHDSGLCAADAATKRQFASDPLNLTLASPAVNRSQKNGKDATEWLPNLNRCWFASREVEVRRQYALTIDRSERDVLEGILSDCTSTAVTVVQQSLPDQAATPIPDPGGGQASDALRLYDDNGNGRITCAEARSHGIAPVRRGHPPLRRLTPAQPGGSSGTPTRPGLVTICGRCPAISRCSRLPRGIATGWLGTAIPTLDTRARRLISG